MPTLLGGHFDVGISLFSQAVSSQVFSAPLSLTSVFGMGTGGPSASSTPTVSRGLHYIITYTRKNQVFFEKIFYKNQINVKSQFIFDEDVKRL